MPNNDNYNRNRRGNTDNNGQSNSPVHGGEFRKGRLSQFKNNNPDGFEVPNEYVDNKKE
ncbi:hypothetical protein AB6A23_00985 [Paenibacillus tarimensis]